MVLPPRGSGRNSHKVFKPKRNIGSGSVRGSTRKPRRPKAPLRIESVLADANNTPEPNDRIYRGLLGCNAVEEIDALLEGWSDKFNGKAMRGLSTKVAPEKRSIVEAMLTSAGSTGVPMLTSEQTCRAAAKMLAASLIDMVGKDPEIEVGMITCISGEDATSHFDTVINLGPSMDRMKKVATAISADFVFGIFELALFNSQGHPNGGQVVQGHGHFLVAGHDVLARAEQVAIKQAGRFSQNTSGAKAIDIRRVETSEINLARIANYLFKPPFKCMNWNPGKNGKPGFMNGSEKGDRFVRYLRLAQIRTMMRFEDTLLASGKGVQVRTAIKDFLQELAKKEGAYGGAVLHPDAIASFWAGLTSEMRGARRWNLPVIKIRK